MSPQALTRAGLRAWLQLAHAPSLPPAVLRALLDAFGSADALLRAPDDAIAAASSPTAVRAVRASERADLDARTDAALAWLDVRGNAIVTLDDPAYPPRLRDLHDPPPLLYVKGGSTCCTRAASRWSVAGMRRRRGSRMPRASRVRCRMRGSRSCRGSRSASMQPPTRARSAARRARSR